MNNLKNEEGVMLKDSIYKIEENKTIVAFGSGAIMTGQSWDKKNQVMVHFCDTKEKHIIGANKSSETTWKELERGQTIIFGFNKLESIDVVIEELLDARSKFLELNP